jgi:hypothetical protein
MCGANNIIVELTAAQGSKDERKIPSSGVHKNSRCVISE